MPISNTIVEFREAVLKKGGPQIASKYRVTLTDYAAAKNGGPVFKFDDIKYNDPSDSSNVRTIQYYIYKDINSVFYAGIGGGKGLLLTDETNKSFTVPVNGNKVETINYINLKNP